MHRSMAFEQYYSLGSMDSVVQGKCWWIPTGTCAMFDISPTK